MTMVKRFNLNLERHGSNGNGWKWIIFASLLFLWPLLLNGYPLVYSDTGTYLNQAIELEGAVDRPPYYSLLIFPIHFGLTLWLIPFVQSMIAAYVLFRAVEASQCGESTGFMWYALALSLGSSLPWFTCQVMPDFFASLSVLIVVILAYHQSLTYRERWAMFILLIGAVSTHLTHFLIALAVLIGLSILGLFRLILLPAKRCYYEILGASVLSCLAFVTYNLALVHKPVLSAMSPVFLLARSIEDGPARWVLDDQCPNPNWFLCTVRDKLTRTSNELLWAVDSPFQDWYRSKNWDAVTTEASRILHHVIHDYPIEQARAALHNFLLQLARFRTGDFEGDYTSPTKKVTRVIQLHFPNEAARFLSSAQVQGQLPLKWINAIHVWLACLSLTVSLFIAIRLWKRCQSFLTLFFTTLIGIAANAFLTGVLSEPIDRFGSRIIWLLLLTAGIGVGRLKDMVRGNSLISRQPFTT